MYRAALFLLTAIVTVSFVIDDAECVTVPEIADNLPWAIGAFSESALACWNWDAQVAADTAVGAQFIFDVFSTYSYNPGFVIYQFAWNDSLTGVFHNLQGEMKVAYNQIDTSSGPATYHELFEMGTANFTRCRKANPYRPSDLVATAIPTYASQKLTATVGNPMSNGDGCDMLPAHIALARAGTNCVQLELHMLNKDGKTDADANATMAALGMPVRWTITPYLNGALLGLPFDLRIADVLFRMGGERPYELLIYNPALFAAAAQQSRRRARGELVAHLPKSWPLNKLPMYAEQLKATAVAQNRAELVDGINWIVEGQQA